MHHIHPTAIISPQASLGDNVTIGAYTIIHDKVNIGNNSLIESHCILGKPSYLADPAPLNIGAGAYIRSHSVLYAGSSYGEGLITGHYVTLREKITAGKAFRAGSYGDFQGSTTIGDHVRTQSKVTIGEHCVIGNYVWIFPYSMLLNDPYPPSDIRAGVSISDYAVIASGCSLLPGVTVGKGALVGTGSIVTRNVAPDTCVLGNPARYKCDTKKIRINGGIAAYPWTNRYHKDYPPEVIDAWLQNAQHDKT